MIRGLDRQRRSFLAALRRHQQPDHRRLGNLLLRPHCPGLRGRFRALGRAKYPRFLATEKALAGVRRHHPNHSLRHRCQRSRSRYPQVFAFGLVLTRVPSRAEFCRSPRAPGRPCASQQPEVFIPCTTHAYIFHRKGADLVDRGSRRLSIQFLDARETQPARLSAILEPVAEKDKPG